MIRQLTTRVARRRIAPAVLTISRMEESVVEMIFTCEASACHCTGRLQSTFFPFLNSRVSLLTQTESLPEIFRVSQREGLLQKSVVAGLAAVVTGWFSDT